MEREQQPTDDGSTRKKAAETRFFPARGFFFPDNDQPKVQNVPKTGLEEEPTREMAKRVQNKTRRPHPEGERRSRGNIIYTIM